MKKLIVAATGAALLSGNAMADMTWGIYKQVRADPKRYESMSGLINSYIMGAMSAMASVNAQMKSESKGQLYCVPSKLSLKGACRDKATCSARHSDRDVDVP